MAYLIFIAKGFCLFVAYLSCFYSLISGHCLSQLFSIQDTGHQTRIFTVLMMCIYFLSFMNIKNFIFFHPSEEIPPSNVRCIHFLMCLWKIGVTKKTHQSSSNRPFRNRDVFYEMDQISLWWIFSHLDSIFCKTLKYMSIGAFEFYSFFNCLLVMVGCKSVNT